jgi:indolepyruvate ferredoxin oxidoreductase alpha subunit
LKALLSGNEAIALAAYHSGVAVAAAYPGTPSTEILEAIAGYPGIHAEWATNEKVAVEVAMGASYAGVRSLVSMKHVGLNVAADPFFAASITGVRGGLVVVSADDPGMHSSQNEQDNRHYARFAKLPVLEPSDSQECYQFTQLAFPLSEQFDTPVMLRTTTRVSHSKSVVEYDEGIVPVRARASFARQPDKFVMIPAHARRRHPLVEERVARLAEYAESFPHNRIEMRDRKIGVITSSIAYQYAKEVMPDASFLKLGMGYPVPVRMIRGFASKVGRLMVVEELDPFLEEIVRAMALQVEGKRYFPLVGEFSLEVVEEGFRKAGMLAFSTHVAAPLADAPDKDGPRQVVGEERVAVKATAAGGERPGVEPAAAALGQGEGESRLDARDQPISLPPRPPVLCPGCPHAGPFFTLKRLGFYQKAEDSMEPLPGQIQGRLRRVGAVVAGDIGCYTLAVLPPLSTMDTAGCMGASIGNALGMEKAGVPNKVIAVIGDSTFLHSGMTPLLNVVYNGGTLTTLILDNSTTAMTGHQEHPGTGRSARGEPARAVDLEKLVRGLGVEDVKVVNAFDLKALEAALRDSAQREEPSVVIARGPCAVKSRAAGPAYVVDTEKCNGCGACVRLGCPAIARTNGKAGIEPSLCVGSACGVCRQICPVGAIAEPLSPEH